MRTTVTLDPDVEHLLREESHRRRQSFKQVLNDAVRASLRAQSAPRPELLPPRPLGLRPGIDPRSLNELADELEVEAHLSIGQEGIKTR